MAVTINGDGTIIGVSVGGLPDGVVDSGTLATNSVNSAELIDGAVDNSHLATGIDATKLADGTITNSELQYINSLSSNAQTQISAAGLNVSTTSGQYDASTTGTITVSGLSFAPQALVCLYAVGATSYASVGFAGDAPSYNQCSLLDYTAEGSNFHINSTYFARASYGSARFSNLSVTSWDSGGVTITKAINNTPPSSTVMYRILLIG